MYPDNMVFGRYSKLPLMFDADTGAGTFDRGEFKFPEKLEFLFSPKRFKICKGGRGSGKSWGYARALLLLAAQRKLLILCTREIQKSIKNSSFSVLTQQIDRMGLNDPNFVGDGNCFHYNENSIWHDNGSQFIFAGLLHNITNIKSMEGVDICWVEEAESISKESWDLLIPTIRKAPKFENDVMVERGCSIYSDDYSDSSEIWACYNPNSRFDDTHVRFTLKSSDDCDLVTMNWRDNPWFTEVLRREKDECKRLNFKDYLHIWEGLTKEETGETTFKLEWLKTWTNPNAQGNCYIVVDPANSKNKKSDYTVIIVAIAMKGENFLVREIFRDRMEMEKFDLIFKLVAKYKRMGFPVTVGYERYGMQMDKNYIIERQQRDNFFFPLKELGAKSTGSMSKIDRIKRLVPYFSDNRIILPPKMQYKQLDGQEVDVMEAFMQEYVTYPFIPESMHDDILDCLARLCDDELGVTFPDDNKFEKRERSEKKRRKYSDDPAGFRESARLDCDRIYRDNGAKIIRFNAGCTVSFLGSSPGSGLREAS